MRVLQIQLQGEVVGVHCDGVHCSGVLQSDLRFVGEVVVVVVGWLFNFHCFDGVVVVVVCFVNNYGNL